MKSFIFRYYINIAIVGFLALIALKFVAKPPFDWKLTITVLGGILSFVYLVQKQKLEETKLFKDFFTEFNTRYDGLNEKLNKILQGNTEERLAPDEINTLYDYFNLCGEEYLYFNQGYILPEVWESWINGMKIFYQDERISKLWEKDLKTNSYYGFNLDYLAK